MVQSSNIFYPEAEHAGRICRHYNMNLPPITQSIKINVKLQQFLISTQKAPYINMLSRWFASDVKSLNWKLKELSYARYKAVAMTLRLWANDHVSLTFRVKQSQELNLIKLLFSDTSRQ